MPAKRFKLGSAFRATFLERPNRFLVRCRADGLGELEAFLPNPGRLWELFLPGATLHLMEAAPSQVRKTRYTCVAVERGGVPIMLHTHATNAVARHLIEERRIPGLVDADFVRAEVPHGRSRFDFLLQEDGCDLYVEVKSVTLFGNGVAMFPDAVTQRGRRHLLELAQLAESGKRTAVVFLCHYPHVRWFMPDFHTDLAFSRTLLDVRDRVRILPVAVRWRKDLSLGRTTKLLEMPWQQIDREARDGGAYLLLLTLSENANIPVGRLGRLPFEKGHYIYVGSAIKSLNARIARHLRHRKKMHWHIDYLRKHASECVALPIRGSERIECNLAKALSSLYEMGPEGFGSTDCDCPAHLFYSDDFPLHGPQFHNILQQFRMARPSA